MASIEQSEPTVEGLINEVTNSLGDEKPRPRRVSSTIKAATGGAIAMIGIAAAGADTHESNPKRLLVENLVFYGVAATGALFAARQGLEADNLRGTLGKVREQLRQIHKQSPKP